MAEASLSDLPFSFVWFAPCGDQFQSLQSLGRGFRTQIVTSLYFDDANIIDWKSSKGSGQAAFNQLNTLIGTPFAEEKRQAMTDSGLFLGLQHDLREVSAGIVRFWPRERLIAKMEAFLQDALSSATLSSGTASKIYGVMAFLEQGIYGRVGCSGLQAIKARQHETDRHLSPALKDSLYLIRAVLELRPARVMEVIHPSVPARFVVASDAALETPFEGTGGFLIVWFNGVEECREAFVSHMPRSLYCLFTPGERKIAQLELIQLIFALTTRPDRFRGRRGVWFLDNSAALMAPIRGRSDAEDLERMSQIVHVLLFGLQCWMFFEWIPSKSNWADAISRLGFQDPWHVKHGFTQSEAFFQFILWQLPVAGLVRVAEYL